MSRADDIRWMRIALREAARGLGRTSPNPCVGAVIVRGGAMLAKGWHRAAGRPHAEIEAMNALKKAGMDAAEAALYITLEPCSTEGRTPPCTDAIIASGFRRVIFGATDPNPAHAGRAAGILKKAGISVTQGVLAEECAALNFAFNHWVVTGLPFVIAKAGLSLDGRLARPPGEGQWITCEKARQDAMRLRAQVDAILIGAGTLRRDNPRLVLRGVRGRQPLRVVLTRTGCLPEKSHLFQDEHHERTLVYRKQSLRRVLLDLGRRGCTSIMIEGGGKLLGAAFDAGLVDRVHFYIAPILCGGPDTIGGLGVARSSDAPVLENITCRRIGTDLRVTADFPRGRCICD